MNRSQTLTVEPVKKAWPFFFGLGLFLSAALVLWLSYVMLDPSWVPKRRLTLLVHLPPLIRSGFAFMFTVFLCILGLYYFRVAGGENIALMSDKGIDVISLKGRRSVLWADLSDINYIPSKSIVFRGKYSSSTSFYTKFRLGIPLSLVETPEEVVIREISIYRPELIKQ